MTHAQAASQIGKCLLTSFSSTDAGVSKGTVSGKGQPSIAKAWNMTKITLHTILYITILVRAPTLAVNVAHAIWSGTFCHDLPNNMVRH